MKASGKAGRFPAVARKYTEAWYWGYLLQGVIVLGLAPILLPLIVESAGPENVGMVVAALYVGQVISPVLGGLADRTRRYSFFYLSGYVLLAAGFGGFVLSDMTALWAVCAFVMGAGAGASNTVSYSYIVEFHPQNEWDDRLGWLQTFYGTGQAAGLMLAAIVQAHASFGMWLAAGLMVPGLLLGSIHLPRAKDREVTSHHRPALDHKVPAMGPGRTPASLLRHYEHLTASKLKALGKEWRSLFGLYLLSWFLLMVGTWIIYNLYPLLMKNTYDIQPGLSSLYYAVGAVIGIFFYALSGDWSTRFGADRIVLLGGLMTLFSIGGMALLVPAGAGLHEWLVPFIFIVLPVAWSPLIVAGTALTGELATIPKGTAMGLFNACTAAASVLAAIAAGWVAKLFSYGTTCVVALVFTAAALILFLPVLLRHGQA